MSIKNYIFAAFPSVKTEPYIRGEFIKTNQNIMEIDGETQYFKVVPAYMLWIIDNKDEELVDFHIINALAEYGRTFIKDDDFFNFKWRCNERQRNVVVVFLEWCKTDIVTSDVVQIERALKCWRK